MALRRLEAADLAPLWDAFQDVIREGASYVHDETTTLDEFAQDWNGRGGEQWIEVDASGLIGAYTLRANHVGRGSHVGTASYFVASRARGRGLGRRLGEHSLERARALGFHALRFNCVVSTNDAALRLWKSLGFEVEARLPRAFRHPEHGFVSALVLRRDLEPAPSEPLDGRVHHKVIESFVKRGRAPSVSELAASSNESPSTIEAALERLHFAHAVVLHPGTHSTWLAHPFSSTPTSVWVEAGARGWWAPCLWCALGVCELAAPDAVIHTRLEGEHEAVRIELRDGELASPPLLVHFATPPREAWNNVVAWCASVQPFASEQRADAWCARHGLPRGECLPLGQVQRLARAWYGRHLAEDWRKWTVAQAQSIFDSVGLRSEFWRLPNSDRPF